MDTRSRDLERDKAKPLSVQSLVDDRTQPERLQVLNESLKDVCRAWISCRM